MKFPELNGLVPPVEAMINFQQTYEQLGGSTLKRKVSGAGLSLNNALNSKIKTTLRAEGYSVLGWSHLLLGTSYVLKCAKPQEVQSASNVITIPAARRTDTGYTPVGIAIVGSRRVFSPATLGSPNEYTVTTVAGATAYQVAYYPEITVVITEFKREGKFGWSLTAEEI